MGQYTIKTEGARRDARHKIGAVFQATDKQLAKAYPKWLCTVEVEEIWADMPIGFEIICRAATADEVEIHLAEERLEELRWALGSADMGDVRLPTAEEAEEITKLRNIIAKKA